MGLFASFAKTWLKSQGWKVTGEVPKGKYVIIAWPHTTNWDLPYTVAVAQTLGFRIHWVGKHTLFEGPAGFFFKALGGVPVDRSKRSNSVQAIADIINDYDGDMLLAVAPEGTRKSVEYWRSGFYHIAKAAGVGIVFGYLDYSTKTGGLGPVIDPSLGAKHVMDEARRFYGGKAGKYPQNHSPIRLREEAEEAKGQVHEPSEPADLAE
ncbi:MAG: 1-acyl-sn-glycerol-3-phosphate acyltransferase [bacterium]